MNMAARINRYDQRGKLMETRRLPARDRRSLEAGGVQSLPRSNPGAPWHIVRRVGRSDQAAIDWLDELGFETYYPMVREMRPVPKRKLALRHRGGGVTIMRPSEVAFFPGYIFVRMHLAGLDWQSLKEIAGVGGLVCKDGVVPIEVSDTMIAALREREVGGAIPGKTPAKLVFTLGQRVKVTGGPFGDFHGIVEQLPDAPIEAIDSDTRIRVALEIFGRATPVDLPVALIEKIAPPEQNHG